MSQPDIIGEILNREGGFSNLAADRGGATNFGITQGTLSDWRKMPATVDDVRQLQEAEAREIYRQRYLVAPRLDAIKDASVLALALDCSVNHGPHQTVLWLQRIAGVADDGMFGPASEEALNAIPAREVYFRLLGKRAAFYGKIISDDKELERAKKAGFHLQAEFAHGWGHRIADFLVSPPRPE